MDSFAGLPPADGTRPYWYDDACKGMSPPRRHVGGKSITRPPLPPPSDADNSAESESDEASPPPSVANNGQHHPGFAQKKPRSVYGSGKVSPPPPSTESVRDGWHLGPRPVIHFF